MKSILRRAVSSAVSNERVYRILDATVLKFARRAEWEHRIQVEDAAATAAIGRISPELAVLHGPFAGMRYPRPFATGSALFPKLLGSYERELHAVLEQICATAYKEIIDVGCAEGYYAVGLARRIPGARVQAYDINPEATRFCEEMAALNGVGDRVTTGAFCSPETLLALPLLGRTLVIADCEGYEKELFTDEVVAHLADHDVLIEVHDQVDIEISTVLKKRFAATHDLMVVRSIDDIEKAHTYNYEELAGYSAVERHLLLGEGRSNIMDWYFFTPKTGSAS